mgnify:CR=1 FL=1
MPKQEVMAEVVGFRDSRVLLMPFESVEGIGLGATVENTKEPLKVFVGEELLGHALDGLGRPLDGAEFHLSDTYPIEAPPPTDSTVSPTIFATFPSSFT